MLIGFSLGLSFRVYALFLSSEVRAACTFLSFLMNKNIRYSILALTEVSPTDILRDEKTFVSQEVFWENQIKYNVPTFLSLFWTEKKMKIYLRYQISYLQLIIFFSGLEQE